jgi:hypothetical protein
MITGTQKQRSAYDWFSFRGQKRQRSQRLLGSLQSSNNSRSSPSFLTEAITRPVTMCGLYSVFSKMKSFSLLSLFLLCDLIHGGWIHDIDHTETACDVPCSGGACLFVNCQNPTCDGGACKFIDCENPSCRGKLNSRQISMHLLVL